MGYDSKFALIFVVKLDYLKRERERVGEDGKWGNWWMLETKGSGEIENLQVVLVLLQILNTILLKSLSSLL